MSKSKQLSGFAIEADNGGYIIALEDENGTTVRFDATRDQLDMIADLIEDCLILPESNAEAEA